MLCPSGSSQSKTILERAPLSAMPITSFAWTSRQARRQSPQWMQAASWTAMAGWLESAGVAARFGKRLSPTPSPSRRAQSQSLDSESGDSSRGGWSASHSSISVRRTPTTRSEAVRTCMPAAGRRMHEAASARSPSISTTQRRQFASAR